MVIYNLPLRASGRVRSGQVFAHYLGNGHAGHRQGSQCGAKGGSRSRPSGQGGCPKEEEGTLPGRGRERGELDSYHASAWVGIRVSRPRDLLEVTKR